MADSRFPGGGGGGTPGGSGTDVQFNDSGSFGGSAGLTWDGVTLAVGRTSTATSTTNIQQLDSQVLVNPAGASDAAFFGLLGKANSQSGNAQNLTNSLTGLYGQSLHEGSGTLSNQYGLYSDVESSGGGTVNVSTSAYSYIYAQADSPIIQSYGHWIFASDVVGAASIGTFKGVSVSPAGAGAVTTLNVAYFNENMTGVAGVGKDFAWYSEGGTNHLETGKATCVGVQIERFTAQSADLLQFLDSDGTTKLTFFDSAGILRAAGYKSSDGSTGATAGPFTTITAITVKNGLVTAITGS